MSPEQIIIAFLGMTTSALLVVLKIFFDEVSALKSKVHATELDQVKQKAETKGSIDVLSNQIARIQTDLGAIPKLREDLNVCHKRIRELITPRS